MSARSGGVENVAVAGGLVPLRDHGLHAGARQRARLGPGVRAVSRGFERAGRAPGGHVRPPPPDSPLRGCPAHEYIVRRTSLARLSEVE
jgi:hypothetical protein